VLAGKRNADIARELFVSLKTVESHTRNIYVKLGVTSRVELVARLGEDDVATSAASRAGPAQASTPR
jgi:DNA-binding NarL/FixJ family response regulator